MKRSLRSWLWHVPLDQEVDEELDFHVEMRTRELVARGMDPKTARDTVLARIGDLDRLKRTCVDLGRKREREMRLARWIEEFRDDVRFAIRQMRSAPGFTLVAAITLALGIGANSAIFALADAALLRPLSFSDPDRLVMIGEWGPQQSGRSRVEMLNLRDWKAQNRTFESLAGIWIPAGGGPTMIGADGSPEIVPGQIVTAEFFDVLGVRPILGRTFLPEDEADSNVVVMSEAFWRQRFAADPALVGRTITLDGRPATVIGIVPAQFQFTPNLGIGAWEFLGTMRSSLWRLLPAPRATGAGTTRGQCALCRLLQVVGRLKPGVSVEAARAELSVIANALAERNDASRPRRITVTPLREATLGRELRLTSILFLGVVGLVLLLCCANVANLILARATARTRELAVRTALGAGRQRIIAQLLTESFVLAALGGVLGLGVGAAILSVAPAVIPPGLLPAAITLGFDSRVAVFGAATALLVGALFGVVPAWHVTGLSLVQAITNESRTSTGRSGSLRSLIVAGEVALAVVVLCGAGLLLRTLLVVDSFEPGYRAERERVLTVDFSVPSLSPGSRYPTRESLSQFYDAIEREVATVPGVRSAGWATTLPLGGSQLGRANFEIVGDPPLRDGDRPSADYQIVSPTYFRALDLSILAGRAFTDSDRSDSAPVCIVNEAFVRRYMRGRDPIGMRVSLQNTVMEIVGVVRQVKGRPDEAEDLVQVYVPSRQVPWPETHLVVRAIDGDANVLAPQVRQAIARVDKLLAVRNIVTLEDVAQAATARHRFRAVLVGTFAALALVLAMVGVFGVLAYSVEQRRREFGVRIALGATTANVLKLVFASAGRVVVAGAIAGLGAAALLSQAIATFLFGVQPLDPVTFTMAAAVLATTAVIAMTAPALRAARVDPVTAFRAE